MFIEKPDERQWKNLVCRHGMPLFDDRSWNMPEHHENITAPTCSGEVILLIFNLAGSCIFVRRAGSSDWFFPMGRIEFGEGIIDAARRKAKEETGVIIEPIGVPLCYKVTISFSNLPFQRWHFVVVAETAMSDFEPDDRQEIEEARLFDRPPNVDDVTMMGWMQDLHRAGTRYLRSLDAMDGI